MMLRAGCHCTLVVDAAGLSFSHVRLGLGLGALVAGRVEMLRAFIPALLCCVQVENNKAANDAVDKAFGLFGGKK